MSNTINVNYMTRAFNQYQQKNAAKDMTMVEYKQYIYNSDKLIGGIEVCTLVLV